MKTVKKTLNNAQKKNPKIEFINCHTCMTVYTVSSLDLFFACIKCKQYIRYMCDICDVRIKVSGKNDCVKCVKCSDMVCKHCAKLFFIPLYIDGKTESICIECDMDINDM